MKIFIGLLIAVLGLTATIPWVKRYVPSQYNPFIPLSITDPATFITRYKLKKLTNNLPLCMAVLERARSAGQITFSLPPAIRGNCPLSHPVRIQRFGKIELSSSFLASCPMAVRSAMFVLQLSKQNGENTTFSPLMRIEHVGSYACRNIYHRAQGRLSEHATAEAWDVTDFQFKSGEKIGVQRNWKRPEGKARWLHQTFQQSCGYFGNSLGPDYNAAHASHFHFGLRGYGLCR
ncbi:extensin [[Pantoea] beijingensis]|uniref:Extensin n=1 Tax=[Pantoea] beijingensis TaxID=1324864 RepID=A0A443IDP4_9GAMM|nr:extensin family protein [[Pantoea] beijingensis]RWR01967.1 extensin [[Pantoea] beijingensis]